MYEYHTLHCDSSQGFTKALNAMVGDGWELIGEPKVFVTDRGPRIPDYVGGGNSQGGKEFDFIGFLARRKTK